MCVCVCVCVHALHCIWLFIASCTVACQAPLSVDISRQEYWNGLALPTLGDLPDSGTELVNLASAALAGGFFTTSVTWEAHRYIYYNIYGIDIYKYNIYMVLRYYIYYIYMVLRYYIYIWYWQYIESKQSSCNAGDLGSIPGLGRSPEGGHGDPL